MEIVISSEHYSEWNYCPAEILCLIFEKLEPLALLSCMRVNRRWRKIAGYIAQSKGKWKYIIRDKLEDYGVTYFNKSTLDGYDMITNIVLWRYVSGADVILGTICQKATIEQTTRTWYQGIWLWGKEHLSKINSISVYKDNLVVVDNTETNYYGITETRCNLIKTLPTCLSVDENDYMILIKRREGREQNTIYLYGKRFPDDDQALNSTPISDTDIIMHELYGSQCFAFKKTYFETTFYVFTWDRIKCCFKRERFCSYFGSAFGVAGMQMFQEQDGYLCLYLILRCGKVVRYHPNYRYLYADRFHIIFRLKIPPCGLVGPVFTYNKCCVVVPGEEFKVTLHGKRSAIVIECPMLQCIASHGNILLLGRSDGKIDIYLKRKLLMKDYIPERQINLSDYVENIEHPEILSIDVHESKRIHHLFIRTKDKIYQMDISHPNLKIVFEDENS